MSPIFLANHLLGDWCSVNFHYSFSLQREEQKQIVATILKTIGEPFEAIKMGEYATAFQTKNYQFVNINKRFGQVQFQGKYFLENSLAGAGHLIQRIYDQLIKLEQIEGRKDTNITISLSRLDIQRTKVANRPIQLFNVEKELENLKSFSHLIYAKKTEGQYRVLGETTKDKIRWKLRRYDKTAQIKTEYSDEEQKLFFSKYPNVQLERLELQISDTQFLSQFVPSFLRGDMDLVDILNKWNKKRKIQIVDSELIGNKPLSESSLETFTQKGLEVGLCKAHLTGLLDNLKNLNTWIDSDPLAKPEEVINQIVFAMGHTKEIADEVKKIWFKI